MKVTANYINRRKQRGERSKRRDEGEGNEGESILRRRVPLIVLLFDAIRVNMIT